jgi:Escherichia/Staphylococcus phage prohead protease
MELERTPGIELRFTGDQAGTITGYAAVWNQRDTFGDIVQPGAFARSLDAHKVAATRPLMLRGHDPNAIVGTWKQIVEDDKGLHVTGNLALESRDGADAHALVKAGAMDGLSIGFRTVRAKPQPGLGRLVQEMELIEISLVGRPAQTLARLTSVRSLNPELAGLASDVRRAAARLNGIR